MISNRYDVGYTNGELIEYFYKKTETFQCALKAARDNKDYCPDENVKIVDLMARKGAAYYWEMESGTGKIVSTEYK